MTLNEMAKQAHQTAVESGWWDGVDTNDVGQLSFPEKLALMHSELSEALEAFRASKSGDVMTRTYLSGPTGKPEGVPIELADVIIRILDVAAAAGMDLDKAVSDKMEYNKSRPHRHGGKRC